MGLFSRPNREQLAGWLRAGKAKPLRRALGSATAEGRALAAECLGELVDREALSPLSLALSKDEAAAVRLAAARALSALGAEAAPPLSLALLQDSEASVRAEA